MNATPSLIVHPHASLDGSFDLFISALGFEKRCCYLAKQYFKKCSRGLALAFAERKVLNYADNKHWFEGNEFIVCAFGELGSINPIAQALMPREQQQGSPSTRRLLIDISSMSRPMIASTVRWLSEVGGGSILATFCYCPSEYVELGDQIYSMSYVGPVAPAFAGWTGDIHPPIVAITGIGGESGLALGAVEYLEATRVWAFVPSGVDDKYDNASQAANGELLDRLEPNRIIKYDPMDAYGCFCALESLAYGSLGDARPIMLPFGPKIFALTSLLVAQLHRPRIPVWRASSEQDGEPVDRVAKGPVSSLAVTFT